MREEAEDGCLISSHPLQRYLGDRKLFRHRDCPQIMSYLVDSRILVACQTQRPLFPVTRVSVLRPYSAWSPPEWAPSPELESASGMSHFPQSSTCGRMEGA